MSKRIFRHLALILLSLLTCTACQQADEYEDTPQDNLLALWRIIDQHYCFLDYKQQALGLDWNEVYSRYSQRLSSDMTTAQLREVMCDMLSELQDGHVNLYTASDVGRYWSWHEDHPKNLDEELRESYLGTDYRIASGLKYRILPDNIGYIVYESFTQAIGEGNLDEVMAYLSTCNGLILDIRGNGGGTLTYADRLAARFTNEDRLAGYISHKTGPGHNQFSTPAPEYIHPSPGIRWQKPCIVLTNRGCFSAANTFVRNIQRCPRVRTLGDQTGGGSGMPFSSELPCGWAIRFSACPMYDCDMNQIEFGIQPHIPCALDPADAARGYDTLIETARSILRNPGF